MTTLFNFPPEIQSDPHYIRLCERRDQIIRWARSCPTSPNVAPAFYRIEQAMFDYAIARFPNVAKSDFNDQELPEDTIKLTRNPSS